MRTGFSRPRCVMGMGKNGFLLSDQQFAWIRAQIKERTGINLTLSKRNLVYNRLTSRMRALGLSSFEDYLEMVETADTGEVEQFVNAITTNVTSFFREEHHFDFLAETALPESMTFHGAPRFRIWSAGCSLGMEAYSIAMVLREYLGDRSTHDTQILATDVDTQVLQTGSLGIYDKEAVTGISDARLRRFMLQGKGQQKGRVRMRPELTSLITFQYLNLIDPWPSLSPFDVIFCRNVVIYFDKPTQAKLWARFGSMLRPGGYLVVGHSESVLNCRVFRPVGRTVYRKEGGHAG